jgi:hypothetical protein
MGYHECTFDDETSPDLKWLHRVQPQLLKYWADETRHVKSAGGNTLCCEIVRAAGSAAQHMSMPCTLASEATEIGTFLSASCFNDDPVTFFRLYMFLLDEFCERIRKASKEVLDLPIGKEPKRISVWGNRWAKHRLQLSLQHHPMIAFCDRYKTTPGELKKRAEAELGRDRCGNTYPCRAVDTEELGKIFGDGKPNHDYARENFMTMIIVPPLTEFLEDTANYLKDFVRLCKASMPALKKLESEHFRYGCF